MISFAIMHAPWSGRAHLVTGLLERVPRAVVIRDEHRRGVWWTAQRAWEVHHPKATHHVVIQDDAILPPQFDELVELMAADHPVDAIPFGRTEGRPTAITTMLPVPAIAPWLTWARSHPYQVHDDCLLAAWCQATGRRLRSFDVVGAHRVPSIRRGQVHA